MTINRRALLFSISAGALASPALAQRSVPQSTDSSRSLLAEWEQMRTWYRAGRYREYGDRISVWPDLVRMSVTDHPLGGQNGWAQELEPLLGAPEIAESRANSHAAMWYVEDADPRRAGVYLSWGDWERLRDRYPYDALLLASLIVRQQRFWRFFPGQDGARAQNLIVVWGERALRFARNYETINSHPSGTAAIVAQCYNSRISSIKEYDFNRALRLTEPYVQVPPQFNGYGSWVNAERALSYMGLYRITGDSRFRKSAEDSAESALRKSRTPDVLPDFRVLAKLAAADVAGHQPDSRGGLQQAIDLYRSAIRDDLSADETISPEIATRAELGLAVALLSTNSERTHPEAERVLRSASQQKFITGKSGRRIYPRLPDRAKAAAALGRLLGARGDWDGLLSAFDIARDTGAWALLGSFEEPRNLEYARIAGQVDTGAAWALLVKGHVERAAYRLDSGRGVMLRAFLQVRNQVVPELEYLQRRSDESGTREYARSSNQLRVSILEREITEAQTAEDRHEAELLVAAARGTTAYRYSPRTEGAVPALSRDTNPEQWEVSESVAAARRHQVLCVIESEFGDGVIDLSPSTIRFLKAEPIGRLQEDVRGDPWASSRVEAPVATLLAEAISRAESTPKRVVICPSSSMAKAPLAMIKQPSNGRYLIDDYTLCLSPALFLLVSSIASAAAPFGARPTAAIFANPSGDVELQSADVECAIVRSRMSATGTVLVEQRLVPSKEAALDALKGRAIWHFATHARFDESDPLNSSISIRGGNDITLRDVFSRPDITAPKLVYLSACETAVVSGGDLSQEFLGLVGAFLGLGAGHVIGSLWRVPDVSSAILAIRFYFEMFANRREPAAALRLSQLWLRDTNAEAIIDFISSECRLARVSEEKGDLLLAGITDLGSEKPFASPEHWAAWVCYGS